MGQTHNAIEPHKERQQFVKCSKVLLNTTYNRVISVVIQELLLIPE